MGRPSKKMKRFKPDPDLSLVGPPVPAAEAVKKWPARYKSSKMKKLTADDILTDGESKGETEMLQVKCHYLKAMVDGVHFDLGDDAYVKAEDDKPDYIARIIEFFESTDGEMYFRAQWFYRAEDTVIKDHAYLMDTKRVFLSDVKDDNPLNCLVSKVKIVRVPPKLDSEAAERTIPPCDLYYDMKYELRHLTFSSINAENSKSESASTVSSETGSNCVTNTYKTEKYLLDLYSGCGAMSTGLCMGASLSGVKLITKWAVDINSHACESLQLNHPETEVRNEAAEDFLSLLKEWKRLCQKFSLVRSSKQVESDEDLESEEEDDDDDKAEEEEEGSEVPPGEFELGQLLAVCYGDPNQAKNPGLYFKVRWKGYGPEEDTWEPYEGLSKCKEKMKDFVTRGYKTNLLPLPGDVYFICGGPPCQGFSGFNRFRNKEAPLEDVKNRQLLVYMDIIDYLKPKYILMENVVDILKFSGGFLGRYAVGRLVSMSYQARLGMMAAGSYGVPQFRMRVFLWGAQPTEKLPPYPLPTHEVLSRSNIPTEFEEITVGYDKKHLLKLEKALTLADAISDLPMATNNDNSDEREYGMDAQTDFQKYIRLTKADMIHLADAENASHQQILYDHQPLQLNEDDYDRVCQIPKKKGANFRDLPGVLVEKNRVQWDPSMERVLLKSGKPLVPDYAMSFVHGRSTKPFGRLWWDDIVNTVVTRAEPHNQTILHPLQDRVLTIRENARLQGFLDCYKLSGPVKERYIQVGNAVAVPVALALGYAFGLASQGLLDDQPLIRLPFKFPECLKQSVQPADESD